MTTPRIFRLVLLLLIDRFRPHGYGLMKLLNEISDGLIRVGPGTIYPTLLYLKTKGLIREIKEDRRKVYELTERGREELEKYRESLEHLLENLLKISRGEWPQDTSRKGE